MEVWVGVEFPGDQIVNFTGVGGVDKGQPVDVDVGVDQCCSGNVLPLPDGEREMKV